MIRRTSDILSKILPSKTIIYIFLKLTDLQKSIQKRIIENRKKRKKENTTGVGDTFSDMMKVRKLMNHPGLISGEKYQELETLFPSNFYEVEL